jgi:hypothetical protein
MEKNCVRNLFKNKVASGWVRRSNERVGLGVWLERLKDNFCNESPKKQITPKCFIITNKNKYNLCSVMFTYTGALNGFFNSL